jgi:hypothetical protein
MKHRIMKLAAFALFATGTSVYAADPSATLNVIDGLAHAQIMMHAQNSVQPPGPIGACNLQGSQGQCVNASDSYSFNGCSFDNGKIFVTGSWDEVFTGPDANKCSMTLGDGDAVVRTSKGLTLAFQSGESVATDTLGGTAYDGTVIPATGVASALAAGVTTIAVNGAHLIYKDSTGNQKEEAFVVSTTPIHMQGQQADGSLVITDGALRVYHQMDKHISDVTLQQIAFSDKTCCHPVSGSITEVMSGSQTGTRSATFTSTCGAVQVVDTDGSTATYNLPSCQ